MAEKDVEIVIGAQDQASKILSDVGDETNELSRDIRQMSKKTEKDTERMEISFKGLKSALGPLVVAFAAFQGVTKLIGSIRESLDAAQTQREAVDGLADAIQRSGDVTGPTIEAHKAFASALQDQINVGDEVTLGLQKQASFLGISNDKLQDATKMALGLSEAMDIGVNEAMKKVAEAMAGNVDGLAEFVPEIRNATTAQEKMALATDLANKGLSQAAREAQSGSGQMQKFANDFGDFQEIVGETLEPIQALVGRGLSVLAKTLQTAVGPALEGVSGNSDMLAGVVEKMSKVIIGSITGVEVVIRNLDKVWELMQSSAELQITSLAEDFKHTFTEVVPAHAMWFADNFTNLISDAFNAALTVIQNWTDNAAEILLLLFEFVRSGMMGGADKLFSDIGEIAGRSLLDGFESQTEALPDIAARGMTAREQQLTDQIGGIASDLGDEFNQKFNDRLAAFGVDAAADLKAELTSIGEGVGDSLGSKLEVDASSSLAAVSSRFLTRGGDTADPTMVTIAGEAKQTNELLTDLKKMQETRDRADRAADSGDTINLHPAGA